MARSILDRAIRIANDRKLPIKPVQIRMLLERPPPTFTRDSFSTDELFAFYLDIHKMREEEEAQASTEQITVPPPKQATPPKEPTNLAGSGAHVGLTLVSDHLHRVADVLSARWQIGANGAAPKAPIQPDACREDILLILATLQGNSAVTDTLTWALGDMVNALRDACPDLDLTTIVNPAARAYNTVITAASVARSFPPSERDPALTFSHYREVRYAKGIMEHQRAPILEIVKDHQLNTRDTRRLTTHLKRHPDPEQRLADLRTDPTLVLSAATTPTAWKLYALTPKGEFMSITNHDQAPKGSTLLRSTTSIHILRPKTKTWEPIEEAE